jgi:3-mercaptopyruvate sulfurtransferase SseA
MRLKFTMMLVALLLTACNAIDTRVNSQANKTSSPVPSASVQPADGVRRITTAELEELLKQGKTIVVDVRNKASYDASHIPGAKWIPVGEVLARADELPRDKTIVTYCS